MSTLFGAIPLWMYVVFGLIGIGVLIYYRYKNRDNSLQRKATIPGILLIILTISGIISLRKNLLTEGIQNIYDFVVIVSDITFAFIIAFRAAPVEKRKMLIACCMTAIIALGTIFGILFWG